MHYSILVHDFQLVWGGIVCGNTSHGICYMTIYDQHLALVLWSTISSDRKLPRTLWAWFSSIWQLHTATTVCLKLEMKQPGDESTNYSNWDTFLPWTIRAGFPQVKQQATTSSLLSTASSSPATWTIRKARRRRFIKLSILGLKAMERGGEREREDKNNCRRERNKNTINTKNIANHENETARERTRRHRTKTI